MGYKLNVDRLSKEEIQYELKIRGYDIDGNLSKLKNNLRDVLAKEAKGILTPRPEYSFVFEEDYNVVVSLKAEIEKVFEEFIAKPSSRLSLRIETKFSHALTRLDNSKPSTEEEIKQKQSLMTNLAVLMSQYELKFRHVSVSVNDEDGHDEVTSEQVRLTSHLDKVSSVSETVEKSYFVKPTPVAKWDIKFSGDPKGLSLNAFLERVDELSVARNVGEVRLFAEACDLFVGKALIWFRANRDLVKSWGDLVKLLRLEFQPVHYDERLLDEIKRRTQGEDESMGIYVAIMKNMFSRLSVGLSEERQLSILCRNILPFYQTQLGLIEILSIQDLVRYGRKIEERRHAVESYVPPSRRKGDLETDLAYIETKTPLNIFTVESQNFKTANDHGRRGNNDVTNNKCWNCGSIEHRAGRCTEPRKVKFCFRCGKPEVTVNTCPKCSNHKGNGFARH